MEIMGHNEKKQYLHYWNSRRSGKRTETICKALMAENFLNLEREMDIHIPEAQKTSNRFNQIGLT